MTGTPLGGLAVRVFRAVNLVIIMAVLLAGLSLIVPAVLAKP